MRTRVGKKSVGSWNRLPHFGFFLEDLLTLSGAGEDCFRGLYLEVSLALVGVASPAYFQ
jgi:hypothetical protein